MIEWFWISHFMFRVIISIQQLLPTFLCTPAPPPPPPCCISPVISGTVRSPCSLEWSCSLHWNTHSTKFSDTMEKHFHMKHTYKNGHLWWSLNKVLFWRNHWWKQVPFFSLNITSDMSTARLRSKGGSIKRVLPLIFQILNHFFNSMLRIHWMKKYHFDNVVLL